MSGMQWFRAVTMLAMLTLGGYGTVKFLYAQDGAAWIQCIWSVAAVFLALIYPGWQAEVLAQTEYRRQMKLLSALVSSASGLADAAGEASACEESAMDFRAKYHLARYVAVRDALAAFPITAFLREREAQDLMHVRALMVETVDLLKEGETAFLRSNMSGPDHFCASLRRIGALHNIASPSIGALIDRK